MRTRKTTSSFFTVAIDSRHSAGFWKLTSSEALWRTNSVMASSGFSASIVIEVGSTRAAWLWFEWVVNSRLSIVNCKGRLRDSNKMVLLVALRQRKKQSTGQKLETILVDSVLSPQSSVLITFQWPVLCKKPSTCGTGWESMFLQRF